MQIRKTISFPGIPVFQIKDVTGTLHIPDQIIKGDTDSVGESALVPFTQNRIGGTLTNPLFVPIEKKSLREAIDYAKPHHSDSKQTSQPAHILFFDKCVIRFIVQQKYEKL